MKFLLLFAFVSLVLISCNCHHEGNGYVVDKATGIPIINARIEVASNVPGKDTLSPPVYTDSNGYYEYSHDFCKYDVSIIKKDYRSYTLSDSKDDTVRLEVLTGN